MADDEPEILVVGTDDHDFIQLDEGQVGVSTGAGADIVLGNEANNVIIDGPGDDFMVGRGGDDTFVFDCGEGERLGADVVQDLEVGDRVQLIGAHHKDVRVSDHLSSPWREAKEQNRSYPLNIVYRCEGSSVFNYVSIDVLFAGSHNPFDSVRAEAGDVISAAGRCIAVNAVDMGVDGLELKFVDPASYPGCSVGSKL